MTNSNPEVTETDLDTPLSPSETGAAFADGLTVTRAVLGPIIMVFLISGWPDIRVSMIATMLFAIAAITDAFDDFFGGDKDGTARKFGWFDDIADSVLIISTLIGLAWAITQGEFTDGPAWAFFVPAGIYIARDVFIGLAKGYELSESVQVHNSLNILKTTLAMFSVIILVASPWLVTFFAPEITAENAAAMASGEIPIGNAAGAIWWVGQGLLCVAAILSVVTGVMLMKNKS